RVSHLQHEQGEGGSGEREMEGGPLMYIRSREHAKIPRSLLRAASRRLFLILRLFRRLTVPPSQYLILPTQHVEEQGNQVRGGGRQWGGQDVPDYHLRHPPLPRQSVRLGDV